MLEVLALLPLLCLLQAPHERGSRIKENLGGLNKVITGCRQKRDAASWSSTGRHTRSCWKCLRMQLMALLPLLSRRASRKEEAQQVHAEADAVCLPANA